jgi:hypothetical protein
MEKIQFSGTKRQFNFATHHLLTFFNILRGGARGGGGVENSSILLLPIEAVIGLGIEKASTCLLEMRTFKMKEASSKPKILEKAFMVVCFVLFLFQREYCITNVIKSLSVPTRLSSVSAIDNLLLER